MDWIHRDREPLAIWNKDKTLYHTFGKRLFDLALTIPALILLAPILGLVALLVRTKLGAPIFFRQERPGLDGKVFTLIKFRTMTQERDQDGNLLPDADRMTPFGQLLRSTSLDELPELFNILKGDMSLIGPRPLLVRYMPYYTERERVRFETLPGLTGLAQINGRNNLPWDERFAFDVWYVENMSLWQDLKIIGLTLLKVVRRENVAKIPGIALDQERAGRVQMQTLPGQTAPMPLNR